MSSHDPTMSDYSPLTQDSPRIATLRLPNANQILPQVAPKREAPLFVIGHYQINAGRLDGEQLEKEALWSFSKSESVFPSRIRSFTKEALSSNTSPQKQTQAQNKAAMIPSFIKQPIASSTIQSPPSNLPRKIPPILQQTNNIPLAELSSIADYYPLIYQKFSAETYESFNTVRCSKSDLLNAKEFDFFEDTEQPPPTQLQQQYQHTKFEKSLKNAKEQETPSIQKDASDPNNCSSTSQQEGIPLRNAPSVVTNEKGNHSSQGYPHQANRMGCVDFESRFECGNLSMAFERNPRSYLLLMQNDINTHGFTQWFYFRVENKKVRGQVDFEIVNFTKPYSLFSQGMKILVHSKSKRQINEKSPLGWHRGCKDIKYAANNYIRKNRRSSTAGNGQSYYYSLKFSYTFDAEDDCVYFAYNYPYSYSMLQNDLFEMSSCKRRSVFLSRRVLCRTLAANRVDLLTITDPKTNGRLNKQTIVISARVHPGETVSSFMMKGLIEYLLEDSENAHYLRNHFVFKIIPMLNPDGVIHGNYRCSLAGRDLNRQWKKPDKNIFPEIFALKRLILNTRNLVLFCDLHGHSIKKNIFVYGCHDYSKPSACRELPYLLSKIYEPFSFKDCNFNIKTEKQGTARVALWNSLRIPNIFTLESSFCGPSYDDIHFGVPDLERMGKALCSAFLIYFDQSTENKAAAATTTTSSSSKKEQSTIPMKPTSLGITRKSIKKELLSNEDLLNTGMDQSNGSDSCPSEDEIEAPPSPVPVEQPAQPIKQSPQEPVSPLKKPNKSPQKLPQVKQQIPISQTQQTSKVNEQLLLLSVDNPPTNETSLPSPTKNQSQLTILRYPYEADDPAPSVATINTVSPKLFQLSFKGPRESHQAHQQQSPQVQQQHHQQQLSYVSPKNLTLNLHQSIQQNEQLLSIGSSPEKSQVQQQHRRYLSPSGTLNNLSSIPTTTSNYAISGSLYPVGSMNTLNENAENKEKRRKKLTIQIEEDPFSPIKLKILEQIDETADRDDDSKVLSLEPTNKLIKKQNKRPIDTTDDSRYRCHQISRSDNSFAEVNQYSLTRRARANRKGSNDILPQIDPKYSITLQKNFSVDISSSFLSKNDIRIQNHSIVVADQNVSQKANAMSALKRQVYSIDVDSSDTLQKRRSANSTYLPPQRHLRKVSLSKKEENCSPNNEKQKEVQTPERKRKFIQQVRSENNSSSRLGVAQLVRTNISVIDLSSIQEKMSYNLQKEKEESVLASGLKCSLRVLAQQQQQNRYSRSNSIKMKPMVILSQRDERTYDVQIQRAKSTSKSIHHKSELVDDSTKPLLSNIS